MVAPEFMVGVLGVTLIVVSTGTNPGLTVTRVLQVTEPFVAVTVQVHAAIHVIIQEPLTVTTHVLLDAQVKAGCGFITVQL